MKLTGYDSVCSWGVAVACSIVTCLAVLPLKVSGMLFVAFMSRYNTDRQNTSLFIVIHGVFASCSSPLVGYLGQILELRNLVILGCFMTSLGVGICFFAENILTVSITIGILCGTGMGLQIFLLPQAIKQHFTENLSRAFGVTWIGSSVGSFAVIPIFQLLLDIYGVSGALLIACGIILHGVPVAMLLQDRKYEKNPISFGNKQPNEKEQIVFKKTIKEDNGIFVNSDQYECDLTHNSDTKNNETFVEATHCITLNGNASEETEAGDTYQNMVTYQEPSMYGHLHSNANIPIQSSINKNKIKEINYNYEQSNRNETTYGSFCNNSLKTENRNKYMEALKTLTIFRNPPFLIIVISMSAYCYIDVFVSTIIIDVSRDKGISHSQEQFLLILLSLAQIVGYTCLSWVTDKGYLTASKFLSIGFLCLGLSCCSFIFSMSFSTMMVSVACFGLCVSMYATASPSLVYEYVEEEKQSMAISSRFILNGPLSFTMGPILTQKSIHHEINWLRQRLQLGSSSGMQLCHLHVSPAIEGVRHVICGIFETLQHR